MIERIMKTLMPPTSIDRQKLLNKLARLKALAECQTGNANETAAAAASMTRLMLEYQIEAADLMGLGSELAPVENEAIEPRARYYPRWQGHLLAAIVSVNNCISYQTRTIGIREVTFRVIGAPEDIANVRKVFLFVVSEIERLAKSWAKSRGIQSTSLKTDFKVGAKDAVKEKILSEKRAVMNDNPHALVFFGKKMEAAEEAIAQLDTKPLRKVAPRAVHRAAYEHGFRAGSSMEVRKKREELGQ
jgi:hypothetical protein